MNFRPIRAQIAVARRRTPRIMVRIARQGKDIARYLGVGVWATSAIRARINVPASAQIDPLQVTMGARHLPVAQYDDYSLVFPN